MDAGLPKALRAKRLPGRWTFRSSLFTYDAMFPDGAVSLAVNADEVLQGRRFPADAQVTRQAAEDAAGDDQPGDWVEYATGRLLTER